MYYVLFFTTNDDSCVDALPRPVFPGHEDVRFNTGSVITAALPVIEFLQGSEHQGVLPDYVPTDLPGMVISARFRQALERAGVDNIDYYPARIKNTVTGTVLEPYYVANLIGRVSCVDRERSLYEPMPGIPGAIFDIEELHLDYSQIGALRMFRLDELSYVIIVDEGVNKAIKDAGITGVGMAQAEGYST